MLADRYCQLLTAYVDGALSPREQQTVEKLLQKSPEARTLLKELEADAARLRQLPRQKVEPAFAAEVMKEIEARGAPWQRSTQIPLPARGPSRAAVREWPGWIGMAIAAAILLMVGIGSYVFFTNMKDGEDGQPIAHDPKVPVPPPKREEPAKTQPAPLVNDLIAGILQGYDRPVGTMFAARELTDAKVQQHLAREFRKSNSVHLEVAGRDNGAAVKALMAALGDHKVRVLVDDQASARLNSANPETPYLVYAENLEADDLSRILQRLGSEVKTDQVQTIHVSEVTSGHRSELSKIFGVDPKKLQAPPAKPMELLNPIPGDASRAKGSKDQKGAAPPAKGPEGLSAVALVLPLEGGLNRSAQIREFLAGRKDPRPGTVQLVVVIHHVAT